MSSRAGLLLLGMLAACGSGAAPNALTPEHSAAIRDSVTATLEQFRAAFAARNVDAVMRFYANDPRFRWIEDGELRYESKGAVATALKKFMPTFTAVELSYFDPVVTPLAPGIAAVATRFAQKVTDSSGVTRGFAGAMSMTLVHADSGWRFLLGHTSSVVPTAADTSK